VAVSFLRLASDSLRGRPTIYASAASCFALTGDTSVATTSPPL
jgi:hypothetical protein